MCSSAQADSQACQDARLLPKCKTSAAPGAVGTHHSDCAAQLGECNRNNKNSTLTAVCHMRILWCPLCDALQSLAQPLHLQQISIIELCLGLLHDGLADPPTHPPHLPTCCTAGSMVPVKPCTRGPNIVSPAALSFTGCSGLSSMLLMRPDASNVKKETPRLTVVSLLGSTRRLGCGVVCVWCRRAKGG